MYDLRSSGRSTRNASSKSPLTDRIDVRVGAVAALAFAAALTGCGIGASSVATSADSRLIARGTPNYVSTSQAAVDSAPTTFVAAQASSRSAAASVDPRMAALKATSSIFGATAAPTTLTENDPQAVELGVRFTSSRAGSITAIRFYQGPKNTGIHVGHLWDPTGKLLASATFIGTTAGGWQQVNFGSSVSIPANTTYTASYHTNVGYYSADTNYFTSALTKSALTVPANGGVYAYGDSFGRPTSVYHANNYWVDVVFHPVGGSTPTPTAAPSPTPSHGGTGDLAGTLCVGGSKYTLDDHDWFDKDTALSVSDSWPESGGAEWSNRFQWGRSNNVGTDQSWYQSQAALKADGLPPVASIISGQGVALKAYPEPPAIANTPGNRDFYFAGLLSNSKAYTTGYWVFSAQLPSGSGWFPALWLISESGGAYNEIDNMEAWGPSVLGANVVTQTEFGSPSLQKSTTIPTGETAQHSYGALVASNYVGFYIDAVPTTKRFTRYQRSALNPVMNLAVCTNNSWCAPAPASGATAQLVVRYYAHYSPPEAPAPCSPDDIATPAP